MLYAKRQTSSPAITHVFGRQRGNCENRVQVALPHQLLVHWKH